MTKTTQGSFHCWWVNEGRRLKDYSRRGIACAAWAAAIDWWSEQLNEVVKVPPKETKRVELTVDKSD